MLKFENTNVMNFDGAIRGVRNPLASWGKADSYWSYIEDPETLQTANFEFFIGENDLDLAKRLCKAGSDHRKFIRQIMVCVDITAPMYWWKQFDTYKVGTVANSTSTMHKIHAKEFTLDDFSIEHIDSEELFQLGTRSNGATEFALNTDGLVELTIAVLNHYREKFIETKDKKYWWTLIQLLPSSYNQTRTVTMNFENLFNMYKSRCEHPHKLDEWSVDFKAWCESLPYFMELYNATKPVVQETKIEETPAPKKTRVKKTNVETAEATGEEKPKKTRKSRKKTATEEVA